VLKSNECGLTGAGELTIPGLNFSVDKIQGLKWQHDDYTHHERLIDKEDDVDCGESIAEVCVGSQACLTFDMPCAEIYGAGAYTCSPVVCFDHCSKIPYTDTWRLSYVYYECVMYYYEWECTPA